MNPTNPRHERPLPTALAALAALALAGCPEQDRTQPPPAQRPSTRCPVTVRFTPEKPVTSVFLAGEFNDFSGSKLPFQAGPDGTWTASLELEPGIHAYKIVADGTWLFDPANGYRKYHGGVENSGLRVPDCRSPALALDQASLLVERPAAGQGGLFAQAAVSAGLDNSSPCSVAGTLRGPAAGAGPRPLTPSELSFDAAKGVARVQLVDLPDGKHTVALKATCGERSSESLLLPFWLEPQAFDFRDTPLYMAVTDRFRDGDPSNNPAKIPGVVESVDYQGGDLKGIEQAIRDGTFDKLGVKALWLTPWYQNPVGAFPERDGTHQVTSYHGYWPVKARAVDPRLGGDAALRSLVAAAHEKGIRVLMDAVLNHVHQEHEYFQDPAKRKWFRTGCVCGTAGCDWTEQRLSCLFTTYLPDVDWTVTEASEQMIADTLWWLEEFDLDGLRLDAVKHVEDLSINNLTARVRERFETAGADYYMFGETAMGWAGDKLEDNRKEYDTIKRYIGPFGLDGQLDFVLYHAVPYRVFAWAPATPKFFLHADYWTEVSQGEFKGALMVNFVGSHDVPRFLTLATYRDQSYDQASGRKWEDLPRAPDGAEPYERQYLAMLNLLTIPGMPLIYYGDEYGEFGGGDPDNRHFMRAGGLTAWESQLLEKVRKVAAARAALRGLRRGPMKRALTTEDLWAYARPDADPAQSALVILNRQESSQTAQVPVPSELGWTVGTVLADRLGGPEVTVTQGGVSVTVPPRGGLVLARK